MKRWAFLSAACAVQVFLISGLAWALGAEFFDGFDAFDDARWSRGEHELGRSQLRAENVSVADGRLSIELPARTLNGGEIRSKSLYYHGTYTARMKLPKAPSSLTGFFLYKSPDYDAEIDIELPNDSSRRILFTTYANGRRTNHVAKTLPFDPTADFHNYTIRFTPDGARFVVDGTRMKQFDRGLTREPMHLFVNAWYPRWMDGTKPRRDSHLLVDGIRHAR